MSNSLAAPSHDRLAHQPHHHPIHSHHHQQQQQHSRYMTPMRPHPPAHGTSSAYYQQPAPQQQSLHHSHHQSSPHQPHNDVHPPTGGHPHRPNASIQHQSAQQQQQPPYMLNCYPNTNGWAGVPLISTASRRPRKHMTNPSHPPLMATNSNRHSIPSVERGGAANEFDENAMLRLAAHAHGAPLILAGRNRPKAGHHAKLQHVGNKNYYNHNLNNNHLNNMNPTKQNNGNQMNAKHFVQDGDHYFNNNNNNNSQGIIVGQPGKAGHETSSSGAVVSEAPGSMNSEDNSNATVGMAEMCLPRIIKPRKRRKKDRKPLIAGNEPVDLGVEVNVSNNNNVLKCDNNNNNSFHSNHNNNNNNNIINNNNNNNHNVINNNGKHHFGPMFQSTSNYPNHINSYINNNRCETDVNALFANLESTNYPYHHETMTISQPPIDASSSSSSTSSTADISPSSDSEPTSSCSCRLCDPSGRIWAFPLRRSCSDQTDAEIAARRKSIGVIGGNRQTARRNEWRSSPQIPHSLTADATRPDIDHSPVLSELSLSRKGSFSDSGDSGCDILSGLSFCDDLLASPPQSAEPMLEPFRFPDVDAAMFSDSINEISRKMMDTMELRSCSTGSGSGSDDGGGSAASMFGSCDTTSSSVFSEEFLLSLEASTLSLFAEQSFDMNGSHVFGGSSASDWLAPTSAAAGPFGSRPEQRDRGNEVINCFDMVWNAAQMLPVQD